MVLRIFNLISNLNVSLLSYERFLVHELVLLLCDVNLAFLNEIAMQFIFKDEVKENQAWEDLYYIA